MNKQKLEDLIDNVENAVRTATSFPGVLELAVQMAKDKKDVDPADHTLAGAIAVAKSLATYVDSGCADGTLKPYGDNAHAKVDAARDVLRSALAAIDGLHAEFPAEERKRADA